MLWVCSTTFPGAPLCSGSAPTTLTSSKMFLGINFLRKWLFLLEIPNKEIRGSPSPSLGPIPRPPPPSHHPPITGSRGCPRLFHFVSAMVLSKLEQIHINAVDTRRTGNDQKSIASARRRALTLRTPDGEDRRWTPQKPDENTMKLAHSERETTGTICRREKTCTYANVTKIRHKMGIAFKNCVRLREKNFRALRRSIILWGLDEKTLSVALLKTTPLSGNPRGSVSAETWETFFWVYGVPPPRSVPSLAPPSHHRHPPLPILFSPFQKKLIFVATICYTFEQRGSLPADSPCSSPIRI